MPNGRVIQRPTAAQAMADVIYELGIEKVSALGYKVCGVDLVSRSKHEKYGQTAVENIISALTATLKTRKSSTANSKNHRHRTSN